MITKENFKEALEILGFQNDTQITGKKSNLDSIQSFKNTESNLDSIKKFQNIESNIYTKYFKAQDCELKVDFKAQKLIYPKEITIHDETTSNFKNNENFVVFECVNRLLDKGYKPEHLELEPRWQLGRENKGGKADILVKDYENKPYLIIECKTTDSKKGEFDKEWDNMQQNGGQLFSYLQQERSVKFLCLYTSDFIESNTPKITYENYIINVQDNKKILNENKKQGYKDVGSVKELFNVWSDTYAKDYQTNGIFEKEIKAYQITHLKPNLDNLKIIDSKAIQKMRHQWATILRANTVGDKGTALNKLMNLFLCKITDELKNKDNLFFCWAGYTADTPFELVDRLQNLYKIGMQEYLKQDITYYSKLEIEKAFKHHSDTAVKQNVFNIFNELKYFQNGDFNFIEVYNKKLFDENFKVLLQIVLMLENVRFSGNESGHNQFLGDFFESYIADMPQHEGQYFTPTPLVNFIISSLPILKDAKVLDFACGAGHFLSEYGKINAKYKANFKGIDKDSRLAKISTIASTMYGNDMQITYDNSLNLNVIENASTNIIISNPPYSVDDFLSVLDEDSKNDFELFKDKNLSPNKKHHRMLFYRKSKQSSKPKRLTSPSAT